MNVEPANPFKVEELPAANDWVQRLIGFAAQCENEGILGIAQEVASAVTSTACHIVSEAGRAMIQQQSHVDGEEEDERDYNLPLYNATQEVARESSHEEERPFLIKIAFQVTDIVLATISPALSSNNNTSMPPTYSNRTDMRLLYDVDLMSTKSGEEFFDAHSCVPDECSVYFDADATVSTCSESDETTNDSGSLDKSSSEETDESQSCIIESIPDMLYATASPSSTYFLDVPNGILSRMDNNSIAIPLLKCDNNADECFAFNSDVSRETYVQAVLDALVDHSLDLLADNNPLTTWQPDDTTRKILQQHTSFSYEDAQWIQILEEQVLKWTSHGHNTTPMLKTRGIINMTPTELNSLLLDCTRVQEYNKCSLGKKDLCSFNNSSRVGETKIVEHVMKIPIVGGKVETLSLTHSRPLLDDSNGFLIVSRSVKKELNETIGNPCFSISSTPVVAEFQHERDLKLLRQAQKSIIFQHYHIASIDSFDDQSRSDAQCDLPKLSWGSRNVPPSTRTAPSATN